MGPRSRERGKGGRAHQGKKQNGASMGPRSRERGKSTINRAVHGHCPELQWGRAHVSAERRQWGHRFHGGWALLQWGRAHVSAERVAKSLEGMRGPALQWGRAHVSAESSSVFLIPSGNAALQWGRAHVSAESTLRCQSVIREITASMGPRSRERGKSD